MKQDLSSWHLLSEMNPRRTEICWKGSKDALDSAKNRIETENLKKSSYFCKSFNVNILCSFVKTLRKRKHWLFYFWAHPKKKDIRVKNRIRQCKLSWKKNKKETYTRGEAFGQKRNSSHCSQWDDRNIWYFLVREKDVPTCDSHIFPVNRTV